MYIFPNWEMLAKLGTWYLVSSIVYPHLHILLSMV